MYFLIIKWKRSEWGSNILFSDLINVLTAMDASVPSDPKGVIGIGTVEEVVIRVRILTTRRYEEQGSEIVRRATRESDQIRTLGFQICIFYKDAITIYYQFSIFSI